MLTAAIDDRREISLPLWWCDREDVRCLLFIEPWIWIGRMTVDLDNEILNLDLDLKFPALILIVDLWRLHYYFTKIPYIVIITVYRW